jgi:hypothetical protein
MFVNSDFSDLLKLFNDNHVGLPDHNARHAGAANSTSITRHLSLITSSLYASRNTHYYHAHEPRLVPSRHHDFAFA